MRNWTAKDKHPAQNADFVATTLMAMLAGWTNTTGLDGDVTEGDVISFAHAAVDIIMKGRGAW